MSISIPFLIRAEPLSISVARRFTRSQHFDRFRPFAYLSLEEIRCQERFFTTETIRGLHQRKLEGIKGQTCKDEYSRFPMGSKRSPLDFVSSGLRSNL